MDCFKCKEHEKRKAVIQLQNGAYCKEHFFDYLEEKIVKTIRKYRLITLDDKVCVAASGGKDSLCVLYFTHLFCKERNIPMFALLIDEGIAGYREKTKVDLQEFCKNFNIELHIASFKDAFGKTLNELTTIAYKKFGRKPCTVCGIFRRTLLNTKARELGATKLVTGHNQDDESQAFMMNVLQGHMKQNASLGPLAGLNDNELYVRRIKPLYFVSEKETRTFCLLKKFHVDFAECPYIYQSYRADIRDKLNELEEKYPSTKSGILQSFLDISEELKQKYNNKENTFKYCERCGEPCSQTICNACKTIEELDCTPLKKTNIKNKVKNTLCKKQTQKPTRRSYLVDVRYATLKNKTVAIVGVGGTGNLVANLLSRAGVGKLILIDKDTIEWSNIERQVTFDAQDIGKKKVFACKEKLEKISSDTTIIIHDDYVSSTNINALPFSTCDLIIDCTDNLETRFVLNKYCIKQNIPLLHTAAIKNVGTVFFVKPTGPCLSCIFKDKDGAKACDVGIVNACVTTVSSIAASVALNYLAREMIEDDMIRINLDTNEISKIKVKKNKDCKICSSKN